MERYCVKLKVESEYWVTVDANCNCEAEDEARYFVEESEGNEDEVTYRNVEVLSSERVYDD